MFIASELRKKNIAEYILYMWQVEDLLRACSFDQEIIWTRLVSRYEIDQDQKKVLIDWYLNLAMMMEKEYVREQGHLNVITNLVNDLNEFHLKMIESRKDPRYFEMNVQNSPVLSDLIDQSNISKVNDVYACLLFLYGCLMLKIKGTEISDSTRKSIQDISQQMGHLSARYIQFENDQFEF
jgi:hypothetical protein